MLPQNKEYQVTRAVNRYSRNITWQTGDPEIFRIGMKRKKAAE